MNGPIYILGQKYPCDQSISDHLKVTGLSWFIIFDAEDVFCGLEAEDTYQLFIEIPWVLKKL